MAWKDIPGWEGFYQVSDKGSVRSLDRVIRWGSHTTSRKGRELKPTLGKNGYPWVSLSKQGVLSRCYVHRLVLLAFVGPCPDGLETLHKDGVRANARLSNLRYGSRRENALDRIAHGNGPQKGHTAGERNGNAQLTEKQVLGVRNATGTLKEIAARYGVHYGTIHAIKTRKTWRHLS